MLQFKSEHEMVRYVRVLGLTETKGALRAYQLNYKRKVDVIGL